MVLVETYEKIIMFTTISARQFIYG